MCEFYNLDEVELRCVPPTKENSEQRYYKLKSGDIFSLNFEGVLDLINIACDSEQGFRFMYKDWTYKKPLFARLKLPKWKIFGFDVYRFMVR